MELLGNYILDVSFNDNVLPISPQMIQEFTITQDIDRLVPTFRFRIMDATNLLGEIVPFDKGLNDISIRFSRNRDSSELNEFNFSVKRRRPLSDRSYEVEGVLKVDNLFSPYRYRALTGNLKDNLETIVSDELGLESSEVGDSLNYEKTVIQPGWTTALFLSDLKDRIGGKVDEGCFFCFIKNVKSEPILVFKSIDELFLSTVKYKFVIGAKPFEDYYPVSEYRIFDNSQIRNSFESQSREYEYFDYSTGTYTNKSINLTECPSLSEFYLIDSDDNTVSSRIRNLGRSNGFTSDFSEKERNNYFYSTTNLIHFWISTWGLQNIAPGDIVKVIFSEGMMQGKLFVYQHTGFWMVKRVVHIFGHTYMTNLLLTRCGIDTDIETTLVEASRVRKV